MKIMEYRKYRKCEHVGTALAMAMSIVSVIALLTMIAVLWWLTYILLAATMYVIIFHISRPPKQKSVPAKGVDQ
jgi:hypothetical protein